MSESLTAELSDHSTINLGAASCQLNIKLKADAETGNHKKARFSNL